MEKEKEADRRRGGKTISKSGQEWTLPAQLGQLKTGQDGKGLLRVHLWCPDNLPRLWDRIDRIEQNNTNCEYHVYIFHFVTSVSTVNNNNSTYDFQFTDLIHTFFHKTTTIFLWLLSTLASKTYLPIKKTQKTRGP